MATTNLFHILCSPKLFFSPCINHHHNHHYLLVYRPKPGICASIKKPRASQKKSNVELCNDIHEFLTAVGLPDDHVPTTKELSEHGRQDLANIVRRRGYKLVREILLSRKKPTYEEEGYGKDVLAENRDDESFGQDGKITNLPHYVSLPNEASAVADSVNDVNNDQIPISEEQNGSSRETSVVSSLEEKVAKFIQNGELDSVEDSESETFNERGSEQVEEFAGRQSVVETEATIHEGSKDLIICNSRITEISNGNSKPLRKDSHSTEDLTMAEGSNNADIEPRKVENQAEINRLTFMLHQKEQELTQLKRQIEEEKHALSILQIKAEREITEAQKLISEKDAELNAAEESLSGLKEVEIQYLVDGEDVEVAGSFNGWHHKVKMDVQDSSIIDPIGRDIQASSDIIGSDGIRKPRLWKTVLWLYPGIYEIKFVVDGHWTTDPKRESVHRGEIQNNVVRVDR